MFQRLGKIVKSRDMFGHVAQLNFNKHHRSHNTIIGGGFSILILISLFALILMKTITLFTLGSNDIHSYP